MAASLGNPFATTAKDKPSRTSTLKLVISEVKSEIRYFLRLEKKVTFLFFSVERV